MNKHGVFNSVGMVFTKYLGDKGGKSDDRRKKPTRNTFLVSSRIWSREPDKRIFQKGIWRINFRVCPT